MGRVLVVTPEILKTDEYYYGKGSIWVKTWEEALILLEEIHGRDALAALYPTAAMQISEKNAEKN
jgi:hypothetical protein